MYTEQLIELFEQAIRKSSEDHPRNILEDASQELYNAVELIDEIFVDERRWFNDYEFIFHIPSERTYVCVQAGIGKTEYQDNNSIYGVEQVYPQETVSIEYVTKDKLRAK